MAKQIVSDPNTDVDDWLDNDDPNDVGEVAVEHFAEDVAIDSDEKESVTDDDIQAVVVNGSMAYEDLRAQILSGDFKLQTMLDKLTNLYIKDMLAEEEYDELIQLARDNANPDKDIEENTDIVKQLMSKVTFLEQTVAAMDARIKKLEDPESEPEEPVVTYESYDPHKWYYKDMTCSFESKNYVCIAPEGVVCTWSPVDYPSYWKLVE